MKIPFALFGIYFVGGAFAAQYGRDVQQSMALQAAADRAMAMTAPAQGALPVRVLEMQLENDIRAGNHTTTIADLERCAAVYPNGSFAWGKPDSGEALTVVKDTCVAEVYMKEMSNGQSFGATDKILAVAYVPAGSSIKCNISAFPEAGYLPAAETVTFPADNPPTIEEVEQAMNNEMKQNAGLKTAAAAIVGGVGSFLLWGNSGDNMGEKIAKGAAGAAAMGGAQFASTQAGHVAGNAILSGTVNAAAGAVMGNIGAGMAGGDSIVVIKDCQGENAAGTKCLWGYVTSNGHIFPEDFTADSSKNEFASKTNTSPCYYSKDGRIMCKKREDAADDNTKNDTTAYVANEFEREDAADDNTKNDIYESEYNFYEVKVGSASKSIYDVDWVTDRSDIYCFKKNENGDYIAPEHKGADCEDETGTSWMLIKSAKYGGSRKLAMIKNFSESEGFSGFTMKKYRDWAKDHKDAVVVGRETDGNQNSWDKSQSSDFILENFTPVTITSEDGGAIDFENRARAKGTLVGTGSGAALGVVSGIQGAKSEIEQRWMVELANYEGSLKNFYCITGTRFLSTYNDIAIIPQMKP